MIRLMTVTARLLKIVLEVSFKYTLFVKKSV